MRGVVIHVSNVVLCVGLFSAAQTAPLPQVTASRVVVAPPMQVSRLSERANIEQMLASARPPVPWVREHKLEPYEPPKEVAPSVAAVAVAQPSVAAPAPVSATSATRLTAETRWRRAATNGSTEMAVTATP